MIKAHIKYRKMLPDKKIEVSDVAGQLLALTYRQIICENTTDVSFDYVILNIGGVEYDLSKCSSAVVKSDEGVTYDLTYHDGKCHYAGMAMEPAELVRKLNTGLF